MLLKANAGAEEKDAWRGKWIKHPQWLGLYAPRLQGLFLRNGDSIGKYNVPGAPQIGGSISDIYGGASMHSVVPTGCFKQSNTYSVDARTTTPGVVLYGLNIRCAASDSSPCYGASDTIMPASADMTMGLYLGCTS